MQLLSKFKEVIFSVVPIVVIVVILNFIDPIGNDNMWKFLIGSTLVIIGLSIFLIGVDIGITPIGHLTGSQFAKSNKIILVVVFTLVLGFIISIAEPSLRILGGQIEAVTAGVLSASSIVIIVSIGVGVFLTLGLVFILYDIPLYKLLFVSYIVILIILIFIPMGFTAMAFDSSGATTGSLTVPFILALAVGASSMKKNGRKSEDDSFGLLGVTSVGAIIMVVFLGFFYRGQDLTGSLPVDKESVGIIKPFLNELPTIFNDTLIALVPILIIFILFHFLFFKLKKKPFIKILKGILYVFLGLVIFLLGVNAGFMDIGRIIGRNVGGLDSKIWVMAIAFLLGAVTVLAEPAVHVLTEQVEDITNGYVSKKIVSASLSIGVGIATILNVIRLIFPGVELWHILVPGYIIALILMFFTPKLFIGMAFDSGGVASGPMNATFIFAFSQGVAFRDALTVSLVDAFGLIALVALTPLITVQILGIIYKIKTKKELQS